MLKYVSLVLFALFTIHGVPFSTFAQEEETARDFGLSNTAKGVFGLGIGELSSPALIVGIILKSLLPFIGIIFFAFIIHGGLKWMTAKGDKDQVKRAQNIILHSTIALVIILSAYALATYTTTKILEAVTSP